MDKLVYHPDHYNHEGRKECWEEMHDKFGVDAVVIFDCLNAYKYLYRAGTKQYNSREQDISKARNYYNHAIEFHSDEALGELAAKCIVELDDVIEEVK